MILQLQLIAARCATELALKICGLCLQSGWLSAMGLSSQITELQCKVMFAAVRVRFALRRTLDTAVGPIQVDDDTVGGSETIYKKLMVNNPLR